MALPTDTIIPGEPLAVQDLSGIESVLAQMWRVAEESAVDEHGKSQPLVRISLGNLIVVCSSAELAQHSEILDRLSVRGPSRIVVVGIEPANQSAGDDSHVHAHIHAVCHRPSPDSPHLCCEHIQLHFGPESIPMLSGIVSPLLEADLPSLLWWNRSWSGYEDEFVRNAHAVGSLLIDLERISTYQELGSIMGRIEGVALHDLAWARIEPRASSRRHGSIRAQAHKNSRG